MPQSYIPPCTFVPAQSTACHLAQLVPSVQVLCSLRGLAVICMQSHQ